MLKAIYPKWIFAVTAAFLGVVPTAQAADDGPAGASVERGRKEFVASCGFCHSDDATGSRGPDLIRSSLVNHDEKGELLFPVVRDGRPDKGMPGLALTQQQVSDISMFLHSRVKESMATNHVPGDYPVEKLLTGDAKAGRAYFNGTAKCNTCHSPTGDLAGLAGKYSPLDLQSKFLYPPGLNSKDTRSTAIVTLSSGKTFKGTLEYLDEFDVAIREASGTYHSWPRDAAKVEVHDPLEAHRELMKKYTDADVHNIFAYLETLK